MIEFANVLITLLMIVNIFVVFNNFLPVDNLKFYKPCALKVPGVSGHGRNLCNCSDGHALYTMSKSLIKPLKTESHLIIATQAVGWQMLNILRLRLLDSFKAWSCVAYIE